MFEFIDVFIVGAILYYIVQAVRRAASSQADKRAPGSIAREDGESLSWGERTQRALEGALEWEEEQQRKREEAELRAELAAVRAHERGDSSPWGARRDEHRRQREEAHREGLPAGGAAPSLSDAMAGVASMLEQHAASQESRAASRSPRESTELTRRSRTDVKPRSRADVARPQRSRQRPPIEVEAREIGDAGSNVDRRSAPPAFADLPGLGTLTPLQRAIVYGEIFGRPIALGGSGIDEPLD